MTAPLLSWAWTVIVTVIAGLQRSVQELVLRQVYMLYGCPRGAQFHEYEAVLGGAAATSQVFGSHVSAMLELWANALGAVTAIPAMPAA